MWRPQSPGKGWIVHTSQIQIEILAHYWKREEERSRKNLGQTRVPRENIGGVRCRDRLGVRRDNIESWKRQEKARKERKVKVTKAGFEEEDECDCNHWHEQWQWWGTIWQKDI